MTFLPVPESVAVTHTDAVHDVLYQSASENSVVNPIVLYYLCGTAKAEPVLRPLRTLGRNHSYLVRNKLEEKLGGGGM